MLLQFIIKFLTQRKRKKKEMQEIRAVIIRQDSDDKQTLGNLIVTESDGDIIFQCKTLELDWEDNKKRVSCIPTGVYKVVTRYSEKYGHHFHITDVEGRSLILIHSGNYNTDILGCILLGVSHTDINGDGYRDVTSSGKTIKKFKAIMPDSFILEII